jgi:hypothetical protein
VTPQREGYPVPISQPPPPEVAVFSDPLGGTLTVLIALGALALTILWARRPGQRERWAAVLAAAGTSALMLLITLVAVYAGWWKGAVFEIPLPVALAIELLFSVAGYTLWLGLYRWLRRHSRRPLLIYVVGVLVFIPVVLLVDPVQMSRGQFEMGGGYTVWIDALVGQVVMLSPVVFYELLRRLPGLSGDRQQAATPKD